MIKGISCNDVKNKTKNTSVQNELKGKNKKKKKCFIVVLLIFSIIEIKLNVTVERMKDFVRSVNYRLMIHLFYLVTLEIYLGRINE